MPGNRLEGAGVPHTIIDQHLKYLYRGCLVAGGGLWVGGGCVTCTDLPPVGIPWLVASQTVDGRPPGSALFVCPGCFYTEKLSD